MSFTQSSISIISETWRPSTWLMSPLLCARSWILQTVKADKQGSQNMPFLQVPFLFLVLFVQGKNGTCVLTPLFHILSMNSRSTFYLLINKPMGRSCLFSKIKNCMQNSGLYPAEQVLVSLCFAFFPSQCFLEIRRNH